MFGARSLGIAAMVLGLGCSDECHDIGCGSTLIVELAPEQGFADGAYDVTLDSPEGTMVCSFAIADGSASALDCTPNEAALDQAELPAFMLVRYFQQRPQALHVVVSLDGSELAVQDHSPEYEDVSLDPEACGGPCTSAQVHVDL
jgi:hypothetical protein